MRFPARMGVVAWYPSRLARWLDRLRLNRIQRRYRDPRGYDD